MSRRTCFSGLPCLLSFPLQLQRKAKLTPAVDTIPLPSLLDFIIPGKMCRAAGWGQTGVTEPTSERLMEVKLRIMAKEACKPYKKFYYHLQVCVGSPRKTRSAYRVRNHLLSLLTSGDSVRGGSRPNSSPLS